MTQPAAKLATYAPAPAPEHYVWWFPGSPVKVHLELGVAQKLKDRLGHSPNGVAQQGLLFGRALDGTTEVLDFDPLLNGNASDAAAALPEDRKHDLVGYYRTEPGDLRLNPDDLLLADGYFAKPHHVFLLIQSSAFGAPNACFFFHKNDRSMADFPFLEFPLDPDLLAIEERDRLSRSRAAVVELPPLALSEPEQLALVPASSMAAPVSTPPVRPPRRIVRKAVAWVVFGGVLGAAGVSLRNPSIRESAARLWNASAKAAPAASVSSAVSSPPSLGLVAQRQASDVQLTWNRESPAIAAATSGVLAIEDGNTRRQIPLNASQVHSGSVLYSPASGQVVMQLAVTTPSGNISESVMVVLSTAAPPKTIPVSPQSAPPPLDPAAPAPAPKASKPFAGIPVVISSSPEEPAPSLTEPPSVNMASAQASSAIPAVVSSQLQGPPPMQPPIQPPVQQPPAQAPQASTAAAANPDPPRLPAVTHSYIPARPITKADPQFPVELKTHVTKPHLVEVKVSIDQHGKVTRAEAIPQKGISEFFVAATVAAARLWRFEPARRDNQPVPSEMTLQFILDR